MSKKAIEAINAAEARADKIRSDAVVKAKEMTDRAYTDGKASLEKAEEEMNVRMKEKTTDIASRADVLVGEKLKVAEDDVKELKVSAELHMAEAKKLIIRRIEERCQ